MQNTILRQVQFGNYMTSVRVVPRKAKGAQSPLSLFLGWSSKNAQIRGFFSCFCRWKCPNSMQSMAVRCWEMPRDEHSILASPSYAPVHLRYHVSYTLSSGTGFGVGVRVSVRVHACVQAYVRGREGVLQPQKVAPSGNP